MKLPSMIVSADPFFHMKPEATDWDKSAHHYRCTLKHQGRNMTVEYHMGSAHTDPPKLVDVLDSLFLESDCDESFPEWCASFGYDADSRKAERTYKACKSIGIRLHKLLGDDFDAIQAHIRNLQDA